MTAKLARPVTPAAANGPVATLVSEPRSKSEPGAKAKPGSGSQSANASGAAQARPSGTNPPLAAVSFVSGLIGLLVANLLLGPLAIISGLVALRTPGRRGRAALGIVLGLADLGVFLLLAAHAGAHHGMLSWNFLSH
jgi:hypothetical protein